MRKLTVILATMILFTGIGISASAQEKKEDKKEKTVEIKMINNDDGKITKIDTVIVLKEGESVKDALKAYNIDIKDSEKGGLHTIELKLEGDDENMEKTVIVSVDDDGKHKVKTMKGHEMIFISDDDDAQATVVELDEDSKHSYKFVSSDGDSIKKVIVMSGGKHWVDEGEGDFMVMTDGVHNMGHNSAMYEGAKPGDTVRIKTIVSINGKETNVNEEEIIVGDEDLQQKQYKKILIIHEDGKQKTKTKKVIITSDGDMQWNDSGENVLVFKNDSKSSKVSIKIDDAGKEDLEKLKLPKSVEELKVDGFFIMFTGGGKMKLSFNIDHKAKTSVRIYDENGKKLFEDVKSDFSGKYSKEISKMKGKMIIQVSQGKKYCHKKLEVEY